MVHIMELCTASSLHPWYDTGLIEFLEAAACYVEKCSCDFRFILLQAKPESSNQGSNNHCIAAFFSPAGGGQGHTHIIIKSKANVFAKRPFHT